MERLKASQFTIERMRLEDVEEATAMRLQSWLDTYVNDQVGVSREWIEARNHSQMSPEKQASRRARFSSGIENGTFCAWVARDEQENIIGSTIPYIDENGIQRVGSLYVDKKWHGKGVGRALMQEVMNWFDPKKPIELGVATYNARAIAFYQKWGFEKLPGSETLFDNKIPEIKMIRKGGH